MSINEQSWRALVSGRKTGLSAGLTRLGLRVLSWPYATATVIRRAAYNGRLIPSWRAGVPVISVGNITVGGTGKTPLVAWIARQLSSAGRKPAILTRGYKASAGQSDEADWLAQVTGAPVIINSDRAAGAKEALSRGADVCLLDDGFQHLALRRDLNIVTIDVMCPFGHGATLPRGLLREPLSALRHADAFVLTRCDQAGAGPETIAAIRRRLTGFNSRAVFAETVIAPATLRSFGADNAPVDSLAGKVIWAFCGLGNPAAFFSTLEGLSAKIVGRTAFDDHHAYDDAEIQALSAEARQAGAEMLVTTAKDAVKLARFPSAADVRWLEVELEFRTGQAELVERIMAAAKTPQLPRIAKTANRH